MKVLAQLFFKVTMLPVIWLIYRVRRSGVGFVPREGGVLLLCNHVSYIDSLIMYLCSPRPVRFVVLEHYVNLKAIGWFLKLFGGIPIRPAHAKEAITRTVEALQEGTVVCLFPEGSLSRLGVPLEMKKGFELIARRAGCPVIPVYMDGLWNSIFSFERGKFFRKRPSRWTCPLQVSFGRPIPPEEAKLETVRQAIWEASVEAFSLRRELDLNLEKSLVKGLKRRRRDPFLIEHGKNGRRAWSRAYTLGLATAMARRWMNNPPDEAQRVGILLPPGPMSVVINYGLFLAGKTPINLPFTIDQRETEAVARSIAHLDIGAVITSRAFMSHLMDFWQGDEGVFIDMKSVITGSGAGVMLLERIRAYLEPAWLTCWRLDLSRRSPGREAVGLVPRPGDDPVLLNSGELHKNALQVTAADFVQPDEVLFSEQSLAAPGGLMMGCWSPALTKGKVVCRSFSLQNDFDALERALLEEAVTIISGTTQFYASLDQPLSISSLRYGIVFGPANQWDIEDWEETLDLPLARAWDFEGRVVTMSRTDPRIGDQSRHSRQPGRHPKSVGRLLPGIAFKIEDNHLSVLFDPVGDPGDGVASDGVASDGVASDGPHSDKNWRPGPREAEIDKDSFLYLRNADWETES